MATIKFFLRNPSPQKPCPIHCKIKFGRTGQLRFSIKYSVLHYSSWNDAEQKVRNVTKELNKDAINKRIADITAEFHRVIKYLKDNNKDVSQSFMDAHFKEFLKPEKDKQPEAAPAPTETPTQVFFRMIDEFITAGHFHKRV